MEAFKLIGAGHLKVTANLYKMSGNKLPHFSITAELFDPKVRGSDKIVACGCLHEMIEEHFPGLYSDLIALHLSDIDGAPMYAVENGLYWIAGAAPEAEHLGERYHGGNGSSARSPEECLAVVERHYRLVPGEARMLVDGAKAAYRSGGRAACKAMLSTWVEGMRPRWKAEAEAAIVKHNLEIKEG